MKLGKEIWLLLLGSCLLNSCGGSAPTGGSTNGGGAPNVSFSANSLSFGDVDEDTVSPPLTVMLTNSGTATLNIASIAASANFAQTNNCGPTLVAEASCTINVSVTPPMLGSLSGTLSVTDNAAGSPQTVSLSSDGVSAPSVSFSPSSLNFGDQVVGSASPFFTVMLTNSGMATLSIASIAASTNFTQNSTCAATLAPGANCTIFVALTPIALGSVSGTVSVTDNAAGSPQTVSLSGNGVSEGSCLPVNHECGVPGWPHCCHGLVCAAASDREFCDPTGDALGLNLDKLEEGQK